MIRKVTSCFLLIVLAGFNAVAQADKKAATIKGRVINSATKLPFDDVRLILMELNTFTTSEASGGFAFADVPFGKLTLIVGGNNAKRDTMSITVDQLVVDLGDIPVEPNDLSTTSNDNTEIPTIAVDEANTGDDENAAAAQGSSSFYVVNNDDFLRTASITFGGYRFRPRGYDNSDVQVNGMSIQDLETGFASFNQIGGLNDVLRNRTITYGLKPSSYTFGTVRGSTYISATAADQRKGYNVSFYNSNRSFRNRVMFTYSTGVKKNGWAFSVSGSRRWAQEGYVPGTFYDGYAIYGAVSKINKKSQFHLTAMASPTTRGKAAGAIAEIQDDIFNDPYYNPAWGYQLGKKRNARVGKSAQPIIIANYNRKFGNRIRWNNTFGFEFGKVKNSNLDFYNAYSPFADYYRNLPSYYLQSDPPNPGVANAIREELRRDPSKLQVQWDRFYADNYANTERMDNVNGTGQSYTGRRSLTVLSNQVVDTRKYVFNSNIEFAKSRNTTLTGGVSVVAQRDEYYRELEDLLGGDYFVNYNQFAVLQVTKNPAFIQNDLNTPNKLVKEGDRYSYDYILRVMKSIAWAQGEFTFDRIRMFASAEVGNISFSREGMMRNGLFPDRSFGKGTTQSFNTLKGKLGATYSINARHSVFVNVAYLNDAPKVDFSYISAPTRDYTVENPTTVKTKSIEFGYNRRTARFNGKFTAYATDIEDNLSNRRFYNDDPDFQTFVNYIMQNVDTRSLGVELAGNYALTSYLNVTGVAAIGESYYVNRPDVTIYRDNDPARGATQRQVYLKNYYLGVGPQSIYCVSFHYHPKNYWHANLSLNYQDRNFVEVNPDRRTQEAGEGVTIGSAQWKSIYAQERLPSAFTMDISGGKSWDLRKVYKGMKHRTLLYLNLGVFNVLNNQQVITSGFEQLRYDFRNFNPNKFPNKYQYAFGLNYYATLSLRF
jgi:hypothetical protein